MELRILLDATGVNSGSGGMTTYLRGLLNAWPAVAEDELLVVGMATLPVLTDRRSQQPNWTTYRATGRGPMARLWVQQRTIPRMARQHRADVLLSTDPSARWLKTAVPFAVTVHDLRHLERPEEFSVARRVYRSIVWSHSIHRARAVLTNSAATARVVRKFYPATSDRIHPIPLGADHVLAWARQNHRGQHAIAFAHWSNKRPQLAIDVWAEILTRAPAFPLTLTIVGAGRRLRAKLRNMAQAKGLSRVVEVSGFLPDREFQRRFASSSLVVITSTLEGFGLPVVEAMTLGIPVVVPRSLHDGEASGGLAVAPQSDDAAAYATTILQMLEQPELLAERVTEAQAYVRRFRWAQTARRTRRVLEEMVQGDPAGGP